MPAVFATSAAAADALSLYIGQSFLYDDNIYRLSDGVEPFGGGQRDDFLSITSFSAVFDRVYSRQRLYASIDFSHVGFAEYGDLDYDTTGVAAGWDWHVGRNWTGTLGFDQSEVARDFADVRANRRRTSVNRRQSFKASADYWWHPDWTIGAGIERYKSTYLDSTSKGLNYEASIPEITLAYRSESGNRLSLSARFTDGEYPDRTANRAVDEGFDQRDLRLSGAWRLTGASRLSGYLGYTRRDYRHLNVRNFSGLTGRLQHDWTVTGKLQFRTTARREIGARQDLIDNFVVTKSLALEPSWTPTAHIALQGGVEWRQRDFGGDPGLAVSAVEQDDVTRIYRLSMSYAPIDSLSFSLSHTHTVRTSDMPANEYEADVSAISAQFRF